EMYWSSFHYQMKIERAAMDGSNRQVIVTDYYSNKPTGLSIDTEKRLLYWAEKNSHQIHYINLANPSVTYHIKTSSYQPFRLANLGARLYWTDRGNYYQHGDIASLNTTTTTDIKILINNINRPKDIYAYDANHPRYGETNCSTSNGGCEHLCLQSPNQDMCVCSNGMTLKDDGKTCYYREFLLAVDDYRRKIFHKSLDDLNHPKTAIPLGNTGYINTVDFDPLEYRIYWTDNNGVISRALLNGTFVEKVIEGHNVNPRGHSIDVIGRNLYWFDTKNKEIGVSKLNGSYAKTLLSLHMKPLAMALDSRKGSFKTLYLSTGENKVVLQIKMNGKMWSENEFKLSVSQGSTEYCSTEPCTKLLRSSKLVKRAVQRDVVFGKSDVLVVSGPTETTPGGDVLRIEVAMLNPLKQQSKVSPSTTVITRSNLCKLIVEAKGHIEKFLQGQKIIKIDPVCGGLGEADKGKQRSDETSSNGTPSVTIALSVLCSVLLVVVLIFLVVRYVR
ncbi:hypothetical protein QZH41_013353, partial [Actinostola sp. cb2023]